MRRVFDGRLGLPEHDVDEVVVTIEVPDLGGGRSWLGGHSVFGGGKKTRMVSMIVGSLNRARGGETVTAVGVDAPVEQR